MPSESSTTFQSKSVHFYVQINPNLISQTIWQSVARAAMRFLTRLRANRRSTGKFHFYWGRQGTSHDLTLWEMHSIISEAM